MQACALGVRGSGAAGRRPWIGGVGILGLAALLGGCKSETAVTQEAVRPVKVAVVETGAGGADP